MGENCVILPNHPVSLVVVVVVVVVIGLLRPALAVQPLITTTSSDGGGGGGGGRIMETIRKSIFEDLGLERIPNLEKANVSQTEYETAHKEYLRRIALSSSSSLKDQRRRLHTFYPAEEAGGRLMNFSSLQIPKNSSLDQAVLRLLVHPDPRAKKLSIYRRLQTDDDDDDDDDDAYYPIAKQDFFDERARWIEFDITGALVNISNNLELHLDKARFTSASLNIFTTRLFASDVTMIRPRRAAPDQLLSLHKGRRTECRGESKKCCRHQMTVTFKDLKGFEFIVQPKSFDAGYCKGRCPPRYNPAHHHALLQSLIWKEDRRKAPRPCCAPSKLTELEILYFDENDPTKLKVSSWKNMRVLECACS